MKHKYLLTFVVLLIISLFLYWSKCQLNINFLASYSLGNKFPFKYFQKDVVIAEPEPGILINESFNSYHITNNWHLWMQEKGTVSQQYDEKGINNSRCLLIRSSSKESWAYSYINFIEVRKGDMFHYLVLAKLHGDHPTAYARMTVFDENKNAISSNLVDKTEMTEAWTKLEKTFTVPQGGKYINFRLAGVGTGEFRFDDVCLTKLRNKNSAK